MPSVFISYRRSDHTSGYASWIYERLVEVCGAGQVFMDVDSLPLGVDFVERLTNALHKADVALVLIGPGWLDASDKHGRRRLDDPGDFVRMEVAGALRSGAQVIPVLVDGASMPDPSRLPADIRALWNRQALVFHRHGAGAINELVRTIEQASEPRGRRDQGHHPSVSVGGQPRQQRKVITALFCDLVESTALGEELDLEVLRGVMDRYFAEIRTAIERHGGVVEKFIGDAVMAVFGVPRVHEDDALRAVRAAAEIRERLPAVAREVGVALRFRAGVNTGPALVGEGENLAIGDAVNVAARLEQAAAPGDIVVGEQTLRLVRDAVEVEELAPLTLKGKSEPVAAFRLLSIDPAAAGFARRVDVPLVGRERELEILRQAWDRAVAESRCHVLTLLGEAGVGKSRLVNELLSGTGDKARVLRGRCLHYGDGITFWPLIEALTPLGEAARQVLEHLNSGGAATPAELFAEVRRLLESLAHERPVVMYLDDLQWAEPMLLDLLDHVADLSRGAPILLLCTGRPELLDERPGWGGGKFTATTVLLEPLAGPEAEALFDELADGLDAQARARVIEASEGNPLFLEEIVALARERGTVEVPPTIQALLAARLEHLGVEERELLERGAIEGEIFHRLAVKALAGERLSTELELRLAGLVRKELIRPHPATLKGDDAFRFRHLLLRDAAYEGLPKSSRAELHERYASWLEHAAVDLLELDEIAGWHLEQAVRYQKDLGRAVDQPLATRAARHLHASGAKASMRGDVPAATNLLERALALTLPTDSLHAQIAVGLAESLVDAGDFARAEQLWLIGEADPEVAPRATLVRLYCMAHSEPQEFARRLGDLLPPAIEKLEQTGDARWLAKAHLVAANSHWLVCQAAATAEELRQAAEYARKAGDEGLRAYALGRYVATLQFGPTPADEIARELDANEREQPGPYLLGCLYEARAALASFAGRFDDARLFAQRSLEQLEALGRRVERAQLTQLLADIELAADNAAGAREALLEGDEVLAGAGERASRSTLQAKLAQACELLGDRERAVTAIELAEALGVEDDLATRFHIQTVRARLALDVGNRDEAERWARSAVEVASRTDFSVPQGETRLELARVLMARDRHEEAAIEARHALALFEAKGHKPYAARARTLLKEL